MSYDIVELTTIPKTFRKEGAVPSLKWLDHTTKKTSSHKAKVLKISDEREELEKLCVNSGTAAISEPTERIFSAGVLQSKKEMQEAKKIEKACLSAANKTIAIDIAADDSIFEERFMKTANSSPTFSSTPSASDDSLHSNESRVAITSPHPPTEVPARPSISRPVDGVDNLDDVDDNFKKFIEAFKELVPKVTKENIRFFEKVVDAMKASHVTEENIRESYILERKTVEETQLPYKIPDFFKTPGQGKVPIWEGIGFYLHERVKETIEARSHIYDNTTGNRVRYWPYLVRQTLIEIYGSRLADFSAKGSKARSRPGIDTHLYKAVFYWACEWTGQEINEEEYTELINKTSYNKRKAVSQVNKTNDDSAQPRKTKKIKTVDAASDALQKGVEKKSEPFVKPADGDALQKRVEENPELPIKPADVGASSSQVSTPSSTVDNQLPYMSTSTSQDLGLASNSSNCQVSMQGNSGQYWPNWGTPINCYSGSESQYGYQPSHYPPFNYAPGYTTTSHNYNQPTPGGSCQ